MFKLAERNGAGGLQAFRRGWSRDRGMKFFVYLSTRRWLRHAPRGGETGPLRAMGMPCSGPRSVAGGGVRDRARFGPGPWPCSAGDRDEGRAGLVSWRSIAGRSQRVVSSTDRYLARSQTIPRPRGSSTRPPWRNSNAGFKRPASGFLTSGWKVFVPVPPAAARLRSRVARRQVQGRGPFAMVAPISHRLTTIPAGQFWPGRCASGASGPLGACQGPTMAATKLQSRIIAECRKMKYSCSSFGFEERRDGEVSHTSSASRIRPNDHRGPEPQRAGRKPCDSAAASRPGRARGIEMGDGRHFEKQQT